MKELLLAPVAIAVILGMLTELEDLSADATARTVEYAEDAVAAMDCAYEARPITDCSPGITSPDFAEEIERTNAILEELQESQN